MGRQPPGTRNISLGICPEPARSRLGLRLPLTAAGREWRLRAGFNGTLMARRRGRVLTRASHVDMPVAEPVRRISWAESFERVPGLLCNAARGIILDIVNQHDPRQPRSAEAGECPVGRSSNHGRRDTSPADVSCDPVANLTVLAATDRAAIAVPERYLSDGSALRRIQDGEPEEITLPPAAFLA